LEATLTWVGLDVHARSTHAAAIDLETGELTRARFGAGSDEVVDWLAKLPQPRAVYEAGPTGFALFRAARAKGVRIDVVAPGKTARPAADRVKTDRKDAELLARLGMAGQLQAIAVPSEFVEGARHLARTREQLRHDLLRARHRVSKLLLLHGCVYPGNTTWNREHRIWLGRQSFSEQATELAFIDLLAAVDGLIARKQALDERLAQLALDERLWPTVARLRCFRGIDTLTALLRASRARRRLAALCVAAQAVCLARADAVARAVG
jgi:transposase